MATAINNVTRQTSQSFAQTMASSWIPHGIRSSMRVSSVLASVRRRKLWRSNTKATRERERKREIRVSSSLLRCLPRRAPLRRVFDAISPADDTAKRRGSRTARDDEEAFSTDAPWTSSSLPCTQFLSFLSLPSHRCCLPRCRFSSGLRGGVICRHRDDDNDGKSQLCENRALPDMRSARWLSCREWRNSRKDICFGEGGFIDFSFLLYSFQVYLVPLCVIAELMKFALCHNDNVKTIKRLKLGLSRSYIIWRLYILSRVGKMHNYVWNWTNSHRSCYEFK